jgi:ECF sigma factor
VSFDTVQRRRCRDYASRISEATTFSLTPRIPSRPWNLSLLLTQSTASLASVAFRGAARSISALCQRAFRRLSPRRGSAPTNRMGIRHSERMPKNVWVSVRRGAFIGRFLPNSRKRLSNETAANGSLLIGLSALQSRPQLGPFEPSRMSAVTHILSAIQQGDPGASEQLLPAVYEELRRLAAQKLDQETPGQDSASHGALPRGQFATRWRRSPQKLTSGEMSLQASPRVSLSCDLAEFESLRPSGSFSRS